MFRALGSEIVCVPWFLAAILTYMFEDPRPQESTFKPTAEAADTSSPTPSSRHLQVIVLLGKHAVPKTLLLRAQWLHLDVGKTWLNLSIKPRARGLLAIEKHRKTAFGKGTGTFCWFETLNTYEYLEEFASCPPLESQKLLLTLRGFQMAVKLDQGPTSNPKGSFWTWWFVKSPENKSTQSIQ